MEGILGAADLHSLAEGAVPHILEVEARTLVVEEVRNSVGQDIHRHAVAHHDSLDLGRRTFWAVRAPLRLRLVCQLGRDVFGNDYAMM